MGRRKSDVIEVKTDMKLKVNDQVIDLRDVMEYLKDRKLAMENRHKVPMIIRKCQAAHNFKQAIKTMYEQLLKAANDIKFPWPDAENQDMIDAYNSIAKHNFGTSYVLTRKYHQDMMDGLNELYQKALRNFDYSAANIYSEYKRSRFYIPQDNEQGKKTAV